MIFWILALGLTTLTIALLLKPLRSPINAYQSANSAFDQEVYKDQLTEVEHDFDAGLLSHGEAELARIEISRRLLAASDKSDQNVATQNSPMLGVLIVAVMTPIIAIGTYLIVGNSSSPDLPLALRQMPAANSQTAQAPGALTDEGRTQIEEMIIQAEAHLVQNPDDGRGWDVLAPVYFRMGEYLKSEQAYAKAIALEGSTALRHAGLGEAIVTAQEGVVTPEAKSNFVRAVELEPNSPRASFFLALSLAQEGKKPEAITAFESLAKISPPDAPWLRAIASQISLLKGIDISQVQLETAASNSAAVINNDVTPLGNPDQDQIQAASEMDAGDRTEMIKNMVSSLDEKLIEEPNNFEGWQRLIRSYMVLKQPDAAADALTRGLAVFAPETSQGTTLIEQAKQLGIKLPVDIK
jgi:cytochrome c-type biogenesis protein CcmH